MRLGQRPGAIQDGREGGLRDPDLLGEPSLAEPIGVHQLAQDIRLARVGDLHVLVLEDLDRVNRELTLMQLSPAWQFPAHPRGAGTMDATIIARTPTSFTLQIEVPYNDSMLDFEETLQERLNEAGVVATAEGLQQFDTDGSPITVGPVKFTSKGRVEKDYQTPYGVATVARHVYQSPQGGPTYCPLDRDARIVVSSTPRFAKVLSHKYAEFSSPRVQVDLRRTTAGPSPAA